MSKTWKNISHALQDLQMLATCSEASPIRGAAHWHAIFMYMAEQCKREQAAAINRNVKEVCNHPSAMQILHEVLLFLTLTETARRSWSERKFDEKSLRQNEYVVTQSEDERRQVLLALLKFLYCMSSTDVARTEFFQNGFLIPLFSVSLSPLCMCFVPKVNQQTRNVKHLTNCQKNCAETQSYVAKDDSGDIRFHATNILCNMCYCDPLKELIGGIAGASRVRALVAIAEYALLQKQFRIVAAASAALRNLTSKRINARILGALQMYGRLLQLLRSMLNASEKWSENSDIVMSLENLFAIFLNASKSVRAVECMSIQTNKMFQTLSDVCEKLKNGSSLYAKFDQNCDNAGAKRANNENDSSDEGSLQADDLIENGDLSSIGNEHSAADATDTSAYETTKNPTKQTPALTQKVAIETRKPRQLLAEDERLLESAQVFVTEQNIDTTSAAPISGTNLRIDSTVPHLDFASIKFGAKVGKGTYSIVHSAQYCGFQMAAKIINTPLPETSIAREKMLLEFRLMAMLRHPNVVQLIGFSCSPKSNQLIVCTEFCARGSLKDNLISVTDMSIRVKFAKNIISGLYWLHSNFIIHRDLKPANLLVREDYSVVVADFGLSLYIGSSKEKRPLSRHFKGNVKYSAPEILQLRSVKNGQRGRQFYQYSFASDVYSFSLILWEILSPDRCLFSQIKSGRTGITQFVVSGGRPKHGAGWPASLSMLLNRCWHADPQQRPTFDRIQQQFDSIVIDFMCPDSLGRVMAKNLWQGNETQEIKFVDFEREFESATGINFHQVSKGADYRYCLQFMLCENFFQRPFVTFERFCNMMHYFGPMSLIESFLENLLRLFKQPWFFGFIRTEEANTFLAHKLQEDRTAQGYYLMRFSCTHKGSFVLHMITHDGKLMHRSIAHQYGSNYTASLDEIHSTEYESLFVLLQDCNQCDTCLKGMQPIGSSPFLKYFKTYQIASVPRHRSSDSGDRPETTTATKKLEIPVSSKKAEPTLPATTTPIATPRPRVIIRQPNLTPITNPVPVQTNVQTQPRETKTAKPAVERHLAGKTISLVSAAKTASSAAATASGGSRWRASMSSNTTSGHKKSKTKNSDLLKFL